MRKSKLSGITEQEMTLKEIEFALDSMRGHLLTIDLRIGQLSLH